MNESWTLNAVVLNPLHCPQTVVRNAKKITEGYQIQMLRKEKNVIQKSYHG